MKYLILISVLMSTGCAITDLLNDERFYSAEQAAQSALTKFNGASIRRDAEYIGYIYKIDEAYAYTKTSAGSGSGQASFRAIEVDGERVAMWHTHGDSYSDFSEQDRVTADKQCITSYMMNKTNRLFIYWGCGQVAAN